VPWQSGKRSGILLDGEIETEIPGTYDIHPGEGEKPEWLTILTGEPLTLKIDGRGMGKMDLSFARFRPTPEVSRAAEFQNIPVSPSFRSSLRIGPENPGVLLEVDEDGDGMIEELLIPGAFSHLSEAIAALPDAAFREGGVILRGLLVKNAQIFEQTLKLGKYQLTLSELLHLRSRIERHTQEVEAGPSETTKGMILQMIDALQVRLENF
jgi:hypothetical protein